MIDARSISVSRLGRRILHDVSLSVARGEAVSIIGPNGAGKSTLMEALLGLMPLDSGTIRLDGQPMKGRSRREIAKLLAYVPQLHEQTFGFRVAEIVEAARYPHLEALSPLSPDDKRAVEAAIHACSLDDLRHRDIDTLSGGERQKVWLAAALAQQSPLLFLDEPTNALDPLHQVDLVRIMRDHLAGSGGLVIVCHDVNLPLQLGGRVVGLKDGVIRFDEPVETLLEIELLRDLFGTDFVACENPAGQHPVIQLCV